MTKEESDGFLRGIAAVMKEQIEAATAPIRAELEALKARPVISLDEVKALIPEPVRVVNAINPEIIEGFLKADEAEALVIELIGKHVQTVKGEAGKPGESGKDADEAAITARVLASIEPMVAKAVSAIPVPRDGRDGLPGLPGAPGTPGVDGKDGASGRDGVDGLGFDDLMVERTGPRTLALKFQRGDRVKEFPLSFPVVLDAGVWEEKEYEAGDGTSHSGCFWIAQEKTTEKPGTGKAWRMAVKKGRDGKDGSAGPVGPKGAPGLNGRNFDGTKAY